MKIKKSDNIIVIAGKDKGKTGKVLEVFLRKNEVLVSGVNKKKKHEKARRSGQKGQILEKIYPIHASNVMLVDPSLGSPTRIGYRLEGGKKVRIARKSGVVIN